MALPDEIMTAQENLNDLWESISDARAAEEDGADQEILAEVHDLIEDAQDLLDQALSLLGKTP